jgi:hypothetical protein
VPIRSLPRDPNIEQLRNLAKTLGADPTIADPDHHSTPLGWARYNQQHDVAEYLAKVT